MEYFIDKILDHKGNLKKKTEIEFLVSWLGYAQEHNSWEPYKACSLIPYYMYMYSMYIYIYTLYGIQDPGPCIHVTVYTDPYPVPHETTNTVYH